MEHRLEVKVPLASLQQAETLQRALDPDPELKPDEFRRSYAVDGASIVARFEGKTYRTLRVGVNGFFDTLSSALETLDEFPL